MCVQFPKENHQSVQGTDPLSQPKPVQRTGEAVPSPDQSQDNDLNTGDDLKASQNKSGNAQSQIYLCVATPGEEGTEIYQCVAKPGDKAPGIYLCVAKSPSDEEIQRLKHLDKEKSTEKDTPPGLFNCNVKFPSSGKHQIPGLYQCVAKIPPDGKPPEIFQCVAKLPQDGKGLEIYQCVAKIELKPEED